MIITADDVFKAGHCIIPGLRDWCATNDLNFRTFIREGCPVDVFLSTGDALAERVVRLKIEREGLNTVTGTEPDNV